MKDLIIKDNEKPYLEIGPTIKELRQEAIKWIKYWDKLIDEDVSLEELYTPAVNAFINFFNITEEDLK